MELWEIKVKDWARYFVVATNQEEAVEKVGKYIFKDLKDSKVDYVPERLELIDDDVIV